MGNIDKYFNPWLCFRCKNVLYQLSDDARDMVTLDEITEELAGGGCSITLNNCLRFNREQLRLYPYDKYTSEVFDVGRETKKKASFRLSFWVQVLETYLKHEVNKDTPSCDQLWEWALVGHLEYQSLIDLLAKWNIKQLDGVIYFTGLDSGMTKRAYQKFYERNIGLVPWSR